MQHGMSEEQRQVMEAHLHPESAPSGGPATVQHVHAEVGGCVGQVAMWRPPEGTVKACRLQVSVWH